MRRILVCMGVLCAFAARGQVVELDLNRAVEIALDQNPTIKVAGMEIERQRLVKRETVGGFLPTVSAEGTYNRAIKKSGGMAGAMSPDNTVNLAGSVGLPLVVPALWQTLRLNDEQMRAAVEAARGSKIELTNQVKKAYYGILMAEQSLGQLRSSEETITQTVEDTRTKFRNEMASEYDLVTAEVQLSNLLPNIYQTENGIRNARKMLGMLLGMPGEVELKLTDDLQALAEASAGTTQAGVENNADLRAMDIQKDVLRRQLGVLRTQRMPSLAAFGSVSSTGMEQAGFDMSTMSIGPGEFEWSTPVSAGVRLSIPIFAGFTNVQKERQLKNNIRQLELQRDYLDAKVRVDADNAAGTIATSLSKMRACAKTIGQAEKGYQISKVRFDAGMGTILELNSAEQALTQARLNYTQAVFDYLSAQADYEKIIGKE